MSTKLNAERVVYILACLVAAGMLLWALDRHSIGYYTILRLVVCVVCAYGLWLAIRWKREVWAFPFGALIVLFQPLVNLRMTRETWNYVDVVVAVFLIVTTLFVKPK